MTLSTLVYFEDRFLGFADTSGNSVIVEGLPSAGTVRMMAGGRTTNYGAYTGGQVTLTVDGTGLSLSTAAVHCGSGSASGACLSREYLTLSDARLKSDVAPVADGLALLRALKPVRYTWLDGRATIHPGFPEVGFLAQEVDAVLPEVTSVDAATGHMGVSYDHVVPVLVAGLQETMAEFRGVEAGMAALRTQLDASRSTLASVAAALA